MAFKIADVNAVKFIPITNGKVRVQNLKIDSLLPEIAQSKPKFFPRMSKELEELIKKAQGGDTYAIYEIGKMGKAAKPAVPYIIKFLNSNDMDAKQTAAEALGNIGDAGAVDSLLNALGRDLMELNGKKGDEQKEYIETVRAEIEAIGRIGVASEKIVLKFLYMYSSVKDPSITRAIENSFKKLGAKAVPYLKPYLRYGNAKCYLAVAMLGCVGKPAACAVPDIVKLSLADDCDLDKRIGFTLDDIGKPAVPYLRKALKSGEWRIRAIAAVGLGNIGEGAADALEDLKKLLAQDKEGAVRARAAYALGQMKKQAVSAVPLLLKALHDPDARVRGYAAIALSDIAPEKEEVISALIWLAKTEKIKEVYIRVICALGYSKSPRALPLIKEALESDDDGFINIGIVSAVRLGKIAKPLVPYLEKIAQGGMEHFRESAKEAIRIINKH